MKPLVIPEWKWDVVTIDFITKLLESARKNDSIILMLDKMIKATHFMPLISTFKVLNLVDAYMKEIARLHAIPKVIVSNWDPKFT